VNFAVFGMGDSAYAYFNKAATDLEKELLRLGGHQLIPTGLGDDKSEDGFMTAYEEWTPEL